MSESFEARSFVIKSEKVTDGAASKKDLHEPHESRHFTLEERLGSGASSYVYAVCAGGRSWAAKFFRQEQGQTPEALQREAQILADLPRSPYLVDFEGYFSTELETSADLREELKNEKEKHGKEPLEGDVKEEAKEAFYFLLMERCNCSLHSLIENSAFSESEAAFATDAILRGLAHLHSLRVVHRDVKDLNIMVADMGQKVCLGDFDLATKIPVEEELIEWKGGTRGYMAPEVCSQRQGGFKADLFSAGVVLHLLLTRSNPFLPSEGSQGPLDWHIVRLFRSESSCKLMYSLLEEDPKLRPTAEEALDFEWVAGGEAVKTSLRNLLLRNECAEEDGESAGQLSMVRRTSSLHKNKSMVSVSPKLSLFSKRRGSETKVAPSKSTLFQSVATAARRSHQRLKRSTSAMFVCHDRCASQPLLFSAQRPPWFVATFARLLASAAPGGCSGCCSGRAGRRSVTCIESTRWFFPLFHEHFELVMQQSHQWREDVTLKIVERRHIVEWSGKLR